MNDIYINPNLNNASTEGQNGKIMVTPLLRVNYNGGIFAYYEGAEYPQKGLSSPEVMFSVGIVKAIFIQMFKIRPSIVGVLTPFVSIANRVMGQYLIKDEYRTVQCMELDRIVSDFIFFLTSNRDIANQFSKIFSHLIEYDNAYRLRFVDIASETNSERLIDDPRYEIKRLLGILKYREILLGTHVSDKFKYISFVLRLFLLRPKYKRAFKKAIRLSNWKDMVYDNTDQYWAFLRTDYNFMGLTHEHRMKILSDNGYSIPVQKEMKL